MNNIESYSASDTVRYYEKLAPNGLFAYEREIITKYFSQSERVLDIGCGAGRTTVALKNMGYDVVGVDYSDKMVESAKALSASISYEVQDVRRLNYPDVSFGSALFSFNGLMLLETYEDRKCALVEIRRVLKNKGAFFFTTPFLDNKIERGYWCDKTKKYNKPLSRFSDSELISLGDDVIEEGNIEFHLHIPFVTEIRNMLGECGYEIVYEGRRLDKFDEEQLEEELDDNYLWVVIKRDV